MVYLYIFEYNIKINKINKFINMNIYLHMKKKIYDSFQLFLFFLFIYLFLLLNIKLSHIKILINIL